MRTLRKNQTPRDRSIPLSSDLELRPRGVEPVSVARAVGPSIGGWVEETITSNQHLRHLANAAREEKDLEAEFRCVAKAADLSLKLVRMCLESEADED